MSTPGGQHPPGGGEKRDRAVQRLDRPRGDRFVLPVADVTDSAAQARRALKQAGQRDPTDAPVGTVAMAP